MHSVILSTVYVLIWKMGLYKDNLLQNSKEAVLLWKILYWLAQTKLQAFSTFGKIKLAIQHAHSSNESEELGTLL